MTLHEETPYYFGSDESNELSFMTHYSSQELSIFLFTPHLQGGYNEKTQIAQEIEQLITKNKQNEERKIELYNILWNFNFTKEQEYELANTIIDIRFTREEIQKLYFQYQNSLDSIEKIIHNMTRHWYYFGGTSSAYELIESIRTIIHTDPNDYFSIDIEPDYETFDELDDEISYTKNKTSRIPRKKYNPTIVEESIQKRGQEKKFQQRDRRHAKKKNTVAKSYEKYDKSDFLQLKQDTINMDEDDDMITLNGIEINSDGWINEAEDKWEY